MENGYIFPLGGNSGGGSTGGESTIAWKPNVTADGDLSWSRSNSTTAPATQNIRGPQGLSGSDGITFIPEIGTVTTVDSTEEASVNVTIDEIAGKVIYNFNIPRGEKGDDGDSVALISDNEMLTTKTYSSAKIETALTEVLDEGKAYTLEEVSKIQDDLANINNSLNNRGLLLVPYVVLESGTSTQTDDVNDWSEYKGFVLGVECTGGDGTSYCETRYIPRNYATITDSFKHVMSLNYSDTYSFIGFARLYVSSRKVTFVTTAFSGWKEPKWFLYGVK